MVKQLAYLSIVFVALLTSKSIFSQNNSVDSTFKCQNLHKGKYMMTGPSGGDIHIKRKKKLQIEHYNRERQKYKFKIEWIDECAYTLTLVKAKGKAAVKKYYGVNVTFKIVNIGNDYHEVINLSHPNEKPIEIFNL